MKTLKASLLMAAILTVVQPLHAQTVIKDGKLDLIKLHVEKLPGTGATPILVRAFGTDGTDLGTGGDGSSKNAAADAEKIKSEAPELLAAELAARLTKLGFFAKVSVVNATAPVPAGALVVEGKFTRLDPGNRATRYLVGFGAGKSQVAIAGVVKDGSGKTLAEFEQERFGSMGIAGGNSMEKLRSDSKSIGSDIAGFLDAWARGKNLR